MTLWAQKVKFLQVINRGPWVAAEVGEICNTVAKMVDDIVTPIVAKATPTLVENDQVLWKWPCKISCTCNASGTMEGVQHGQLRSGDSSNPLLMKKGWLQVNVISTTQGLICFWLYCLQFLRSRIVICTPSLSRPMYHCRVLAADRHLKKFCS